MTSTFGRRNGLAEPPRPVKLVLEQSPKDEEPLNRGKAIITAAILGALLFMATGTGMYHLYADSVRREAIAKRDLEARKVMQAAETFFSYEEAKKRARNEMDIIDFKIRDLRQQMKEHR